MLRTYQKLFEILSPREKRIFLGMIFVMILAAFAELVSLSAFLGLLGVLASPNVIQQVDILSYFYDRFGFETVLSFQISLSLAVAFAVLLAICVKAAAAYAITRFTVTLGHFISTRLFRAYSYQPYSWMLNRSTSDLSKNILGESEQVANSVATPALRILANVILVTTILCFLIYIDPVIALASAVVIGGGYALIYALVRMRLSQTGEHMLAANRRRFFLVNESMNGFKEMKLAGIEQSYSDRFYEPSYNRARNFSKIQIMTELPRFALEGITFLVLLGMVLVLLVRGEGDIAAAVPTLGVFVFSIMRLLPALQQIYFGLARLRSGEAVMNMIHKEYMDVTRTALPAVETRDTSIRKLERELVFDKVGYTYPSAAKTALNDLSISIKANTTIGVVGGTGAGKTTFVDLILGLLRPQSGEIRIDGEPLTDDNLRSWQNALGYVPQQIYLNHQTVTTNIAFGVPTEDVDPAAVEQASRTAALHEFVTNELPDGYDTIVGERGSRLSGGQRQRIGIARALYRDPSILIMDEATSALDNITESAVMEAVQNLQHNKTIFLIAHRLSTVRNCDMILLMEHGKVVATGTYDELLANNASFKKMVMAGNDANA